MRSLKFGGRLLQEKDLQEQRFPRDGYVSLIGKTRPIEFVVSS